MSETVYIETSILGYLTAKSTKNLIVAANIEITKQWWKYRRSSFILYASEIVQDETAKGDQEIAEQRLNLLQSLMFLDLTEAAIEVARKFLQQSNLPPKAELDALHIALATVYGLDYLHYMEL